MLGLVLVWGAISGVWLCFGHERSWFNKLKPLIQLSGSGPPQAGNTCALNVTPFSFPLNPHWAAFFLTYRVMITVTPRFKGLYSMWLGHELSACSPDCPELWLGLPATLTPGRCCFLSFSCHLVLTPVLTEGLLFPSFAVTALHFSLPSSSSSSCRLDSYPLVINSCHFSCYPLFIKNWCRYHLLSLLQTLGDLHPFLDVCEYVALTEISMYLTLFSMWHLTVS